MGKYGGKKRTKNVEGGKGGVEEDRQGRRRRDWKTNSTVHGRADNQPQKIIQQSFQAGPHSLPGMTTSGGGLMRRSSIYETRIAGLYDLEETIGKGHYAVVKLAKHVFTGEKVAVKVIDKTKLDSESKAHLMQEVRCMKLVQHPNIVRLYQVIDTQSKLFLILELADFDLYEYLLRFSEKGLKESDAQNFFCQIVEAIHYCHKLHVVHRDLKPENVVFLSELSMVKLTDFGFSNLFTPGQHLDTSCGSLAYSAPEILLGDSYNPPAVDVWSLGVILYMLVTGRLPFQEANDSETLTKILDCSFPLPNHLSEPCKKLICRLLVRDAGKRATVEEIMNTDWVKAGRKGHAQILPLISRQQVTEEQHAEIVEEMVSGGIGDMESIHKALEEDQYNHTTATYYLLAERLLKKERTEEARKLLGIHQTSSNPTASSTTVPVTNPAPNLVTDPSQLLELNSLALSPRCGEEKKMFGAQSSGVVAKCSICPPENCSCGASSQAEASSSTVASGEGNGGTRSLKAKKGGGRQRVCSMVREESEDDMDGVVVPPVVLVPHEVLSTSATAEDPPFRVISPSTSPSSTTASGRTSPLAIALSTVAGTATNPPTTPTRYKAVTGSLRKLGSSPHLRGICEEGEDVMIGAGSRGGDGVGSVLETYSSVRMIRPRQAVVSPDVIRRYERVYGTSGGGSRSRRSTSCSSSEASDDDISSFIHPYACKKRGPHGDGGGGDDDSDPGGGGVAGAGGFRYRRYHRTTRHRSDSAGPKVSSESTHMGSDDKSTKNSNRRHTSASFTGPAHQPSPSSLTSSRLSCLLLDTNQLIGKLQILALAPIPESGLEDRHHYQQQHYPHQYYGDFENGIDPNLFWLADGCSSASGRRTEFSGQEQRQRCSSLPNLYITAATGHLKRCSMEGDGYLDEEGGVDIEDDNDEDREDDDGASCEDGKENYDSQQILSKASPSIGQSLARKKKRVKRNNRPHHQPSPRIIPHQPQLIPPQRT